MADGLREGIRRRARPMPRLVRAIVTTRSAEAVHDLRVASRRLRAAMVLLERDLPRRRIKPVARRLRRLTRTLGLPRERDVYIADLEELHGVAEGAEERAAIEFLLERMTARRDRARRRMVRKLRRVDAAGLRRRINELTKHVAERPPAQEPREAMDVLGPLIEHAFAGLPALTQSERPGELHEMRIAVKRLRYALEWLAPAAAGGFAGVIQRLTAFQDSLGRHHDGVMLEEALAKSERRLEEHGRGVLRDGVRLCRERVSTRRRRHYEQFLELAAHVTASSIQQKVRAALEPGERRPAIGLLTRKVGG